MLHMADLLATVAELAIYPVKSMAGIAVPSAHVGLDGILGDRQYSFVRSEKAARNSFPWMTAREVAKMLLYRPAFATPPTEQESEPAVRVRTPEGTVHDAGDPALTAELAEHLGQPVFLLKSARGIFDCQHVSLFSMASLRGLSREAGCSIDRRQFRANLYLEPASGEAFEEERWAGYLVQIGEQALLGITQRDSRCMMINLHPDTGEQKPQVLRTVAQGHEGQTGVYANVVRPGPIRVGDAVRLIAKL